jgi:hypothetical protein
MSGPMPLSTAIGAASAAVRLSAEASLRRIDRERSPSIRPNSASPR